MTNAIELIGHSSLSAENRPRNENYPISFIARNAQLGCRGKAKTSNLMLS